MKLKQWAYVIFASAGVGIIFIILSGVNILFMILGFVIIVGGLITSHITCRCPNCDCFLNVDIVLEASIKTYHCHRCGKVIDTNTKVQIKE